MRYFITLRGKERAILNSNEYLRNKRIEVDLEEYNSLKGNDLFVFEEIDENPCVNICLAYSPNWRQYIRYMVHSIFKHCTPPVKIFLLTDDRGKVDIDFLLQPGFEIDFINAELIYRRYITEQINVDGRFTKYTLYRLLLPQLIDVNKLLYVDADTLIIKDVREFFEIDMADNYLAGCIDTGYGSFYDTNVHWDHKKPYMNAGVTLYNLKQIRKDKLMDEWVRLCNKTFYNTHDQDILNKTCKDKIIWVNPRFNTSISTTLSPNPSIVHFAGGKPWQVDRIGYKKDWDQNIREYEEKGYPKIPKTIHYSWFGDKPKPQIIKECIDSWKKHMPDWVYVEWSQRTFNVNINPFVKKAWQDKKYAFINDYVRLWTLYNFGGLYLDCDIRVVKPLDPFLVHRCFTGHETKDILITATQGSEPDHPYIKYLLGYYDDPPKSYNPNTGWITRLSAPLIEKQENGFTYLKDGVVIYPVETFCSYDHRAFKIVETPNAYAYHLFQASWSPAWRS